MRVSGRWSSLGAEALDTLFLTLFVLGPPVHILDEASTSGAAAEGIARMVQASLVLSGGSPVSADRGTCSREVA